MKDLAMIIGCKEMLTIGTNDLRLTLLQLDLVLGPKWVISVISSICGHVCCEKIIQTSQKPQDFGAFP